MYPSKLITKIQYLLTAARQTHLETETARGRRGSLSFRGFICLDDKIPEAAITPIEAPLELPMYVRSDVEAAMETAVRTNQPHRG